MIIYLHGEYIIKVLFNQIILNGLQWRIKLASSKKDTKELLKHEKKMF